MGLAAETLFLTALQKQPALLCPMLVNLLQQASAACPLPSLIASGGALPGMCLYVPSCTFMCLHVPSCSSQCMCDH